MSDLTDHICRCECHQKGMRVMHCVPCCGLTYEKYLEDDKIDFEAWGEAEQRRQDWLEERKKEKENGK